MDMATLKQISKCSRVIPHTFPKFQSGGYPEGVNACGILSVSIASQLLTNGFVDFKVVFPSSQLVSLRKILSHGGGVDGRPRLLGDS